MAGINVFVADTDEAAAREFTVVEQMLHDGQRGLYRKLQPPVEPDSVASQGRGTSPMLRIKAVGSPSTVKAQLEAFVDSTGVDELITVTYAYDPEVRYRSLRLLAEVWF